MKRHLTISISAILLVILPHISLAQTFSVQGVLRDPLGKTVDDGAYSLTFKLYEQQIGGTEVWTETQGSVEVLHGVFTAELGVSSSLSSVPFDTTYYLGISIEGGTELAPRFKLTKAPSAMSTLGTNNVFPSVGNIGAGTTNPTAALHIVAQTGTTNDLLIEDEGGNPKLVVNDNNRVGVGVSTPEGALHIKPGNDIDPKLLVQTTDGSDKVVVTGDGKLGVGVVRDSINDPLTVKGNLRLRNGGAILFDDNTSIASANFGGLATGATAPGNVSIIADADENGTGNIDMRVGGFTKMWVDQTGNVGIGTDAPTQLLTLNSGGITRLSMQSTGGAGMFNAFGADPTDGPFYMWKNTAPLRFATATSDGGGGFTERMRITATGNVGIGTASPSNKLTVAGAADFTGNVGIGTASPSNKLTVAGAADFTGNVGIGTASPSTTLHIEGPDGINETAVIIDGDGDASDVPFRIRTNPSPSIITDSDTKFIVKGGGNVGIGTASPSQLLTLNSSGITRLAIRSNGGSGLFSTLGSDPTDGPYYLWKNTKDLRFATGTDDGGAGWSEKMRITSGGNVGIGTASPSTTLHIEGPDGTNEAAVIIDGDGEASDVPFRIRTNPTPSNITDSDTKFIVKGSGNVGIGTASPSYPLDVSGTAKATNFDASGRITAEYASFGGATSYTNIPLIVKQAEANNGIHLIDNDSDAYWMWTFPSADQNLNLMWYPGTGSTRYYMAWISTIDGSWNAVSDVRMKENISALEPVLDKIKTLGTYRFNYQSRSEEQIGFMAQDLEKHFPEVVHENDGVKGVAYAHLTPILVRAIQEQQSQIDTQASKIESLENAIGKLTARLDALEKE